MRRIKPFTALLLSAVLIFQLACGGGDLIKSFRVALAASGPLVDSLVASGAIPQSKASSILRDFDDGAACALTLQNAFKAIPKDDPNVTQKKLSASVNAMRCWRVVVNRQNFAAHPRVQQAANIADGILASLVVFYSESGETWNEVGRVSTVSASSEDELNKKLKEQIEQLKASLKP